MSRKAAGVFLTIIVVAGVGLRLHRLAERTFWFDEAFSHALIHDFGWTEMLDRTGRDVHPPFYFIALRIWAAVFGDGIVTLRLFSVLMAALTMVGAYLLVVEAFSRDGGKADPKTPRAAGLTAAALLAVSTMHVYWSQEARMYTLATALLVWSSWFLLRAIRLDSIRWYVAYAFAAAALMYTHNYGLFSAFGQGLFVVVYYPMQSWKSVATPRFWRAVLGPLTALWLYLPWLPVLLQQRRRVAEEYWIGQLNWWTMPDACQELVFPVNAYHVPDHWLSLPLTGVLLIVVFYLARRPNPGRGLLLALILTPPVVTVAISLVSVPIVHSRYYLFAYVAAICGLAGLICQPRSKSLGVMLAIILVLNGLLYTEYYYRSELQLHARPGIRGAVEYIRQHRQEGEPVVVTHPCVFYTVKRYLRDETTPLLYLPSGHLSHYMGSPIFRPEDSCSAGDLMELEHSTIWVVSTTGYGFNWKTCALPSQWEQDPDSQRDFREVSYFQGVVSVCRYQRDRGDGASMGE